MLFLCILHNKSNPVLCKVPETSSNCIKKNFLNTLFLLILTIVFTYVFDIIESTNNKALIYRKEKIMMTADIYTAKNVYTEMLNTEPFLLTSAKNLSYADQAEIEKDFLESKKWIAENAPELSIDDAMYYVAYDWSITVGVIKYLLAII